MIVPLGIGTFLWDMNGPQREDALTKTVALLDKPGTDLVVREVLRWSDVQATERGAYDWAIADSVATAAAAHGVRVWWILSHPPNWATAPGGTGHAAWPCPPYVDVHTAGGGLAIDHYQAFCAAAANRYGPGGDFWVTTDIAYLPCRHFEVWNEEYTTLAASRWDGDEVVAGPSQPADYAHMYHKAAIAISTVPGAIPVAGVCERTWNSDPVGAEYLKPFLATLGYVPLALSVHPYVLDDELPSFVPPTAEHRWAYFTQVQDIRAIVGPGVELWITEIGVPSVGGDVNEAGQAAWFQNLWSTISNQGGVDGVVLFATHHPDYPDKPGLPGYQEGHRESGYALWHTGATNHDLAEAKPAAVAITALPALISGDLDDRRLVTVDVTAGHIPAEVRETLDDRYAFGRHTHTAEEVYGLNFSLGEKVDKTVEVSKLYGTNGSGQQATYTAAATETTAGTVPVRDNDNGVRVGLTPTLQSHATSKGYVDESIETSANTKVDKTEDISKLYGTNDEGVQVTYAVSAGAESWTTAFRDGDAGVHVGLVPTHNEHAGSKKYIDDYADSSAIEYSIVFG